MITIYGASDDLVEVAGCEGADEFNSDDWEGNAELEALRGKLAAAEHFADIWKDTLPELPDAYMCTYTCAEANAAAGLYRALGDDATAEAIIANHAHYDEDGDQHYAGTGSGT